MNLLSSSSLKSIFVGILNAFDKELSINIVCVFYLIDLYGLIKIGIQIAFLVSANFCKLLK